MKPTRNDVVLALVVAALAALEVRFNRRRGAEWAALVTELPFALALAWRRPRAAVDGRPALRTRQWVWSHRSACRLISRWCRCSASSSRFYSLAANEPLRRAIFGFALLIIRCGLSAGHYRHRGQHGGEGLGNFAFGVIIAGGAWVAGLIVRARTQSAGAQQAGDAPAAEGERARWPSQRSARASRVSCTT